jgi:hypothetical protein
MSRLPGPARSLCSRQQGTPRAMTIPAQLRGASHRATAADPSRLGAARGSDVLDH